jgi:hypothetical protein
MSKFVIWDDNIRFFDGLNWAEFDCDGSFIKECPDPGYRLTEEQKVKAAEQIKTFGKAPFVGNVYLRFNNIPKNGKSKNWATGKHEAGLSVYELKYNPLKGAYCVTGEALEGALIQYIIEQAPIYFVAGDEITKGSDREPILASVKILSKARYDNDKEGYIVAD